MKNSKSNEIFQNAKRLIPGGVNSPVRAFGSVGGIPPFIKSAKGSKLYDVDGNEYIDYIGSWGPMILGHTHPKVKDAVIKAMDSGFSFGLPTENEVKLAELISLLIPSMEMVRLTSSGTEAAMSAVRLARAFTKRSKIVKFEGCYHGHSDALLVKAGSGVLTSGILDSNGVTSAVSNDTLTLPFNDIDSLNNLFEKNGDEIAAVILEPIPANMGLIIPDELFLEKIRALTEKHGAILIFDEVISGFRVSIGGAQEIYNIKPDLTILGKIIGGGFPIGAFGGRSDIMNMLSPVGDVYQAGTLSGNPISVSAGLTVLTYLSQNRELYKTLDDSCAAFVKAISESAKKYNIDIVINRIASLFTVFFTTSRINCLNDAITADREKYTKFFNTLLSNGVMLPPSPFEAIFLSIAHSETNLLHTLNAMNNAFDELQ